MRATIELGRRPQAFWLRHYDVRRAHRLLRRENAFRANFRMFQAMVDAYNQGHTQAMHCGAMAAVGGLQPDVQQAISDELGGEIARPAQCWELWTMCMQTAKRVQLPSRSRP